MGFTIESLLKEVLKPVYDLKKEIYDKKTRRLTQDLRRGGKLDSFEKAEFEGAKNETAFKVGFMDGCKVFGKNLSVSGGIDDAEAIVEGVIGKVILGTQPHNKMHLVPIIGEYSHAQADFLVSRFISWNLGDILWLCNSLDSIFTEKFLDTNPDFSLICSKQWINIFVQLIDGLRTEMALGIVDKDIKDRNYVVECISNELMIYHIDFGGSKIFPRTTISRKTRGKNTLTESVSSLQGSNFDSYFNHLILTIIEGVTGIDAELYNDWDKSEIVEMLSEKGMPLFLAELVASTGFTNEYAPSDLFHPNMIRITFDDFVMRFVKSIDGLNLPEIESSIKWDTLNIEECLKNRMNDVSAKINLVKLVSTPGISIKVGLGFTRHIKKCPIKKVSATIANISGISWQGNDVGIMNGIQFYVEECKKKKIPPNDQNIKKVVLAARKNLILAKKKKKKKKKKKETQKEKIKSKNSGRRAVRWAALPVGEDLHNRKRNRSHDATSQQPCKKRRSCIKKKKKKDKLNARRFTDESLSISRRRSSIDLDINDKTYKFKEAKTKKEKHSCRIAKKRAAKTYTTDEPNVTLLKSKSGKLILAEKVEKRKKQKNNQKHKFYRLKE